MVEAFTVYMGTVMKHEGKNLGVFFVAVFWLLLVAAASSVTMYALSGFETIVNKT